MEGGHELGDGKAQVVRRLRTSATHEWYAHPQTFHRKLKKGLFDRNKGTLVALGSHQRPGIDYGESFSPVVRLETLRTILALAAIRDLDVIQFDITSAYLRGTLKEEVYMKQPEGYVAPGKEDWVWGLKVGLYGLCRLGERGMKGPTLTWRVRDSQQRPRIQLYTSRIPGRTATGLRVDDCVAIGPRKEITDFSKSVDAQYGITALGEVRWYSAYCRSLIAPHARSRYPMRHSSTPFLCDSTSPMRLLSRRPSPQELAFLQSTVLPRKTKLRGWRIGHIGFL